MSRLGPVMTPEDAYASAKLGIAEAINSGLTTIHDWSHNIIFRRLRRRRPARAARLRHSRAFLLRL